MPGEPVSEAVAARPPSPTRSGGRAGRAWAGLCGLTAVVHLGGLYLARDLRAHLLAQLGLWLLAGLVWLLALWVLRRATPLPLGSGAERRALGLLWAVALLVRLPAVCLPVGHSDDVYRYLWDGAVQRAGLNPYLGPPDDPQYAAVRAALPELHGRINHRHLPTIYPPAAQLSFRLSAALTPSDPASAAALRLWKGLVVVADLLVLALLIVLCRALGRDVRWATVWGVAPLPAMELAYNGHLESLGVLPLLLALGLWRRAGGSLVAPLGRAASPGVGGEIRRWRPAPMAAVGALVMVAVLVKPVAAAVLPAMLRLPRRTLGWLAAGALLAAVLVVGPYGPKGALPPSLGEYGRRWRSNEGVYAGLQAVTSVAVRGLYRPPYYQPWRWPRLARALTGRDRDTVWPDELAAALARGATLLALGALTVWGVRRRWPPLQLGLTLLLGYQLLTPVLHPWYELWPLALAALWPPLLLPVVLMAALAPLAYLPLAEQFAGRGFHEAVWPRLMQHGAGWAALLWLWLVGARPLHASFLTLEPKDAIDAICRHDKLPPQTL